MVTEQTENPTFVSWLIQKKSGKTPLEIIPLYINLMALGRRLTEMPVTIINRKIYQIGVLKIANNGDTFIFCGKAISFNFTVDLYIFAHI